MRVGIALLVLAAAARAGSAYLIIEVSEKGPYEVRVKVETAEGATLVVEGLRAGPEGVASCAAFAREFASKAGMTLRVSVLALRDPARHGALLQALVDSGCPRWRLGSGQSLRAGTKWTPVAVDLLWDPAFPSSTRSRLDGKDVPLAELVAHLGAIFVREEKEGRKLRGTLRIEKGVPTGEIARITGALNGVTYGPIDIECRAARKTTAAPAVEVPRTFAGRPIPEDHERIEVTLTKNGELWLSDRKVTLGELSVELKKANPEGKPSSRALLIRVSRHALWRHVQWTLMCGAKAGFYRVAYVLERDQRPVMLEVPLSRRAGFEVDRDAEDQILGLTIRGKELDGITAVFLYEIEVEGRAGEMPSYRWLKTETSDVARLEMELKRSLRAVKGGEGRRMAVLRVDPGTAFSYVAALMDSCVRIGMDMVHLRGTPRITEEIARAERLPFETTR